MVITQGEISKISPIEAILDQIDPSQSWGIASVKLSSLGIQSEIIMPAETVWYITAIKTP